MQCYVSREGESTVDVSIKLVFGLKQWLNENVLKIPKLLELCVGLYFDSIHSKANIPLFTSQYLHFHFTIFMAVYTVLHCIIWWKRLCNTRVSVIFFIGLGYFFQFDTFYQVNSIYIFTSSIQYLHMHIKYTILKNVNTYISRLL